MAVMMPGQGWILIGCKLQGKRLEVSDPHALAPTLILSHEITEGSPLHGLKDADLREADGAICVSVAAIDDHSLQVLHSPGWPQCSVPRSHALCLQGCLGYSSCSRHRGSLTRSACCSAAAGMEGLRGTGSLALHATRLLRLKLPLAAACAQEVYAKIVFEGDSIMWDHRFAVRAPCHCLCCTCSCRLFHSCRVKILHY
jgi:hypothetical protein